MRSLKSSVAPYFLIAGLTALALPLCAQEEVAPAPAAPEAAVPDTAAPKTTAPEATPVQIPTQTNAQAQLIQPPAEEDDDINPFALDGPLDMPGVDPQNGDGQRKNQPNSRRMTVEMRLRAMMSDFGLTEASKQDALIAYLGEDEVGKATVRDASRRLMTAIRRNLPEDKMRDVIAVYKNAIATDKERRIAAQNSLDAKIGFSLDPHLEAVLYLFGVLGDGQSTFSAASVVSRGPMPMGRPPGGNRGGDPNRTGGNPFFGNQPPRGMNPFYGGNPANATNMTTATKALGPIQRAGVVYGTVVGKGDIWIDVKSKAGIQERFMPFWTTVGEGGGYNRAVIDAIAGAKAGDLVRLEWVLSEKRRVVKLDPWVPGTNDQDAAPVADEKQTVQAAAPVTAPGENIQP